MRLRSPLVVADAAVGDRALVRAGLRVVVAAAVTTNAVGNKGGSWNNNIAQLTVSERWYIYNAPVISRQNYNGGRGVR